MLRFLWWIVLSALYCLSAWWMYVPWTVKITNLFFIMFHLCLIGFYSRFVIFHWFVQCALHVLIMFFHVFICFDIFFYYYSLICSGFDMFFLIFYWHLRGFELNVTSCSLIFQLFFVKMEVGQTICSPMVPSTIVSWHQPSQKTWTLALATLGHTDVPWVASARVHVFWPQNEIPPKFQNDCVIFLVKDCS